MLRHLLAAATAALVAPAVAGALTFAPTITFDVVGGDAGVQVNALGTGVEEDGVRTWTLSGPETLEGVRIDSWSAKLKEDPFVTNNIVVTNTTAFTQTFIATVLLPIPAYAYDQVISSSVGVTTTDSNGNGILSFAKNGATPIYQGTVNGVTVLSLDPPGLPLTTADCPVVFPGCTATSATGVASLFVPAGSATSIGITLTFDLSPGDSAGLTSRFEIVPEAGTAALIGLGLLGLSTRRRRV